MSTELSMDPSDPFNLLLSADSTESSQQPDWPTLWLQDDLEDCTNSDGHHDTPTIHSFSPASVAGAADEPMLNLKYPALDFGFGARMDMDLEMDRGMGMGMDMISMGMGMGLDFDPNISIDPSALHFDNKLFLSPQHTRGIYNHDDSHMNLNMNSSDSTAFPLTFDPSQMSRERRLSITSSSSSSGASLSPVLHHAAPAANPPQHQHIQSHNSIAHNLASTKVDDPAEELAQSVRLSAGVMLAVPAGGLQQQMGALTPNSQPRAKLPIPRLPRSKDSTDSDKALSKVKQRSQVSHSTSPAHTPPHSDVSGSYSSSSASAASTPSPPPSDPVSLAGASASVGGLQKDKATLGTTSTGRPKTSHTTIERRYRTNLNARIQSLRMAVPALRVLEEKSNLPEGGKTATGVGPSGLGDCMKDIVDERGFVDGVKVARKCSKANVLGKAVEYIRVLKKREARLTREQNGLKSLIGGLVGGPALLKEWETEWRARFGGEEMDEVEGDGEGDGSDDDDDEGGVERDDADREEEEEGRKRKRAKPVKRVKAIAGTGAVPHVVRPQPQHPPEDGVVVPEKRKRGRPRKVVTLPVTVPPLAQASQMPMQSWRVSEGITQNGPSAVSAASAHVVTSADHQMDGQIQSQEQSQDGEQDQHPSQSQPAQQYLLATFAIFSFFNSPLTSSNPSSPPSSNAHAHAQSTHKHTDSQGHIHEHTGSVVGSNNYSGTRPTVSGPPVDYRSGPAYSWRDAVQVLHLLVTILVFLSIVMPWLPSSIKKRGFLARWGGGVAAPNRTRRSRNAGPSASRNGVGSAPPMAKDTPTSSQPTPSHGTQSELERLRETLGVKGGVKGLLRGAALALQVTGGRTISIRSKSTQGSRDATERAETDRRAWARLGELCVLQPETISLATRIETFVCMSQCMSQDHKHAADLVTLSLLVYPLSKARAEALWANAGKAALEGSSCERLVLERLNVREAVDKLASSLDVVDSRLEKSTPISVLAEMIVLQRIEEHAAALFVRTVVPRVTVGGETDSVDGEVVDEARSVGITVDAARALGGKTIVLGDMLERVWSGIESDEDNVIGCDEDAEGEITSLLRAVLLYRRIFPEQAAQTFTSDCINTSSSSEASRNSVEGRTMANASMLSPPPSPPPALRKNGKTQMELRRLLGTGVFDCARGRLEDARDRVVDMLVECGRVGKADS